MASDFMKLKKSQKKQIRGKEPERWGCSAGSHEDCPGLKDCIGCRYRKRYYIDKTQPNGVSYIN